MKNKIKLKDRSTWPTRLVGGFGFEVRRLRMCPTCFNESVERPTPSEIKRQEKYAKKLYEE